MIIKEGANQLNVRMELIVITGNLSGKVTDVATGVAIPGVTVTLGGNTTSTDTSGNYGFSGVPVGNYAITFSKTGYNTVTM